jgi:hypothetical protein
VSSATNSNLMQPITVRVQTRLGMARIDVEPSETLQTIASKLQEQFPALTTFKLSRDPGHKGSSLWRVYAAYTQIFHSLDL